MRVASNDEGWFSGVERKAMSYQAVGVPDRGTEAGQRTEVMSCAGAGASRVAETILVVGHSVIWLTRPGPASAQGVIPTRLEWGVLDASPGVGERRDASSFPETCLGLDYLIIGSVMSEKFRNWGVYQLA